MRDLIVVGEALVDIYCLVNGVPAPMSEDGDLRRHLGGAPANFAVNCTRLGLNTALITRVGKDPMGDFLMRKLRASGVDTARIKQIPNSKTGISFVSVENGERAFDFYGAPSADLLMEASDIGEVDANVLHYGSNTLILEPGIAATQAAIKQAKKTSCDLNVRRYRWPDEGLMRKQLRWACAHATWLKVSDDELQFVASGPEELLDMGPTVVAITHGPGGASLYTKDEKRSHPTLAKNIVDTTGAGDAFWAGCVASLLKTPDLDAALRLGSETAATCIARVGAT